MTSIRFRRDLSPYVSAELLEPPAHAYDPGLPVAHVPGRPGGVVAPRPDPTPLELTFRLYMDVRAPGEDAVREAREMVRDSLRPSPMGTKLTYPAGCGRYWSGAFCIRSTPWSGPGRDASCEVTFLCPDPIRSGEWVSEEGDEFVVGGTWPTLPRVEMVADGTEPPGVRVRPGGECVRLLEVPERGTEVTIDFLDQDLFVSRGRGPYHLWPGSDFFEIGPGGVRLEFSGCSSHTTYWDERWL